MKTPSYSYKFTFCSKDCVCKEYLACVFGRWDSHIKDVLRKHFEKHSVNDLIMARLFTYIYTNVQIIFASKLITQKNHLKQHRIRS